MIVQYTRLTLFGLILFLLVDPLRWGLTFTAVLITMLWPIHRWKVVMGASVFMWLTTHSAWQVPELIDFFSKNSFLVQLFFKVAVIITAYFLAYICLRLQKTTLRWMIVPLVIYITMVGISSEMRNCPLSLFFSGLEMVFRAFIWPLAATVILPQIFSRFSKGQTATLLAPFWQLSSVLPVPLCPSTLLAHEALDKRDFDQIQKKGLRLLTGSFVLIFLAGGFDFWAFRTPFTPLSWGLSFEGRFLKGFFSAFLLAHGTWPSHWAFLGGILAPVFKLFLDLAIGLGVTVSSAQMMGFDLPKMVNKPYIANSFNNFLGRFLFYYNQLLTTVFFPFFWLFRPRLLSPSARLAFPVFLTVWLGGFTFHLLRDAPPEVLHQSAIEYILQYLNTLPYYFLFGLVSSLSLFWRRPRQDISIPYRLVMSACYFVLYGFVFSFNLLIQHEGKSWLQLWTVFKTIF